MTFRTTEADAGQRLDQYLQGHLPQFSRSRLQTWIKAGRVSVNGAAGKPSSPLRGGETIDVEPAQLPPLKAAAEDLPVDVLYEDEDVIAVNKPAGMTVHAGAGQHSGTLTNALLHRFQSLSQIGGEERPGIVHRIDRFTSGVLLVARNDAAHRGLAAQFAERTVEKTYLTLVEGAMERDEGSITTSIARDPVRRIRMTARLSSGRAASTEWRVLKRWQDFTYLQVRIHTGRTHQIRVHMASIGHPVAGDTLYGARAGTRGRFFLHAASIAFNGPGAGERIAVRAPLPPELRDWLAELE